MANKKSQASIEFIVSLSFVFLFFTIFFVVIQWNTQEKLTERDNLILKNTAYSIKEEINLAAGASDGYLRKFIVPDKIGSKDYDAQIIGDMIYLKTDDNKMAIALPIFEVTGDILVGENIIKKENGVIYLN